MPVRREEISATTALIIGSTGMLGSELVAAAARRGMSIIAHSGPEDIDITDRDAVFAAVREANPDVVLNAAAYTDVDGAEHESAIAMRVNRDGPGNLAASCREHDAVLVHFSTDYVFNGTQQTPYKVTEEPDPVTQYGRTKLAGERAIVQVGCRHLILRTSWLFAPHGKNFLRTILRLASERDEVQVVNDQRGRPTSCCDLADMAIRLVETVLAGDRMPSTIVHATNSGDCTWYEFACEIVRIAGLPCNVQPCSSHEMTRPARRPAYSVLDLSEITELLGMPRHWREALASCMNAMQMTEHEYEMKE